MASGKDLREEGELSDSGDEPVNESGFRSESTVDASGNQTNLSISLRKIEARPTPCILPSTVVRFRFVFNVQVHSNCRPGDDFSPNFMLKTRKIS